MRITAKITDRNSVHSRLSVWVNGGLIVNPGGICLRNEEVEDFLDHLKIPVQKIKAKLNLMIRNYGRWEDQEHPMINLEKQIAPKSLLCWIEEEEKKLMVDGFWEVKDKHSNRLTDAMSESVQEEASKLQQAQKQDIDL